MRPPTVQGTEELIDDAIGDAGRVLTSARREGIEFVKEDDARRTAARTLEEVASELVALESAGLVARSGGWFEATASGTRPLR